MPSRGQRPIHVATLLLIPALMAAAQRGEITPGGERLAQVLDAMDVEHRWLAGHHISWRTGESDPRSHQHATHCSAFVAAACDRLGVYILRPPQHGQELLANAQNLWLKGTGERLGWRQVRSAREAQHLANRGVVVVASYRNPNPHKPGHIAVVRPSAKPDEQVDAEGPDVAQAGAHNDNCTSLKHGFSHHPMAWENGEIRFFAHAAALEE